jgi:hypothetical protein
MRKTFATALRFELVKDRHHSRNRKHVRRRPRLYWFLLFLFVLLGPAKSRVCGQDVKPRSQSEPASSQSRERRALQEQWFLRGRSSPGQPSAAQRYRAHLQKMRMRAARAAKAQKSGTYALPPSTVAWSPPGPAPLASDASGVGVYDYGWVSGRATAVAIDPADPTGSTVYIGGAYGGVWKSTNATQAVTQTSSNVTWSALTDNQATLAVGAIAIQPGNTNSNNSVILVGTGETNSSADSYYGLGILRSKDAGSTWALITSDTTGTRSFAGMGFSKIAFSSNPSSLNMAVAAAAGASEGIIEGLANPLTANLGLYYSGDSGVSWSYANVSDNGLTTAPGSATSVAYNASANKGAGQFFAALRYHGFYSSSDGITWSRLAVQPGGGLSPSACPANPSSSSCPIYRAEIAVVPSRNEMYVWYVDANDFDQGIWESIDGGASWTQINEAGIVNCGDQLGCGTEQATYNLELAAVPNGNSGVTDLYAGAINLYKCEITVDNPTCTSNAFLNLTHAYGCSSIAKVHPAQHALAFVNTSAQDVVMYFANDGGIYRSLDGYNLLTGTCGGTNPFDSLNMTLGSMTQFISFSEASNDASTFLGGTQGNGSPGTQSTGGSWQNVNAGDGGYTQINPNNEEEWFVSNPPNATSGVNIFSCTNSNGISCHTQDFQSNPVVSSATVGGDTGAYYPPYILDPQNPGEMIVGTCRMWRGSSTGGGYTVLSHGFETGGDGICTGGEINLVRSLAAGGPLDNNHFSNVIYAGTDGFGPLIPTTPPGGHIWVSTNVSGGISTWVDQTGSINPNNFPISSIAMDTSYPDGSHAYVGIMGFSTTQFPTSHVWKTTDSGNTWVDFTGNFLPNVPVNSIVVDPASTNTPGKVYVGTDVGVFSTPTASSPPPNWTEVGAPGGYLPNVAVTALGIFTRSDSTKLLRASTYGRGVWEFPLTPDFSLSISNTPITIFAGQVPPVFTGTIAALGGYASQVNLSCNPGSTCSVVPSFVNPPAPPPGTPLTATVVASSTPGNYTFDLHGAGTDPNRVTNDAAFTLKVVDFNLTAPSPANITVAPSSVSGPVSFQVTGQGAFDDTVNLSCSNLPSGATCNFLPSSSVNPNSTTPVAITLTIDTTATATAGTFPITISGSVANGPTKSQSLSLTITLDYSLVISNPALQAYVNSTVNFKGVLSSLNGYNSPVNLSCGAGAPVPPAGTCSASPTPLVPTTSGAPFIVTVGSGQCGVYNFNIVATGTDAQKTTHLFPVSFTATPALNAQIGYTLDVTNSPQTAPVNTLVTFNGTLTGTTCYIYPVNLSCGSGGPPTCRVAPASPTPTVSGEPFAVTVSSDVPQIYSFNITAVGTDPNAVTHSFLANFTSTGGSGTRGFSFTISPASSVQSLPAGQPAIFALDVVPSGGLFPGNAILAYSSNCPPLSTCSLSTTQVSKGSGNTHVTFTITTTAPVIAGRHPAWALRSLIYALWLSLPGLIIVFGGVGPSRRRRRRLVLFLLLALIVPGLWLEIACSSGLQGNGTGGNGQAGTPPGTYTMTVSGTMSSLPEQTAQVQLTVN